MPRFTIASYDEEKTQELTFQPSDGDLRLDNYGCIEKWNGSYWEYVGDLKKTIEDSNKYYNQITELQTFMWQMQDEQRMLTEAAELENKDNVLRRAGEHLRNIEAISAQMLQLAKDAKQDYLSLTAETKEKFKTFDRLNTPYPVD